MHLRKQYIDQKIWQRKIGGEMGQGSSTSSAKINKNMKDLLMVNNPLPDNALSRIKIWNENGLDNGALYASALFVLFFLRLNIKTCLQLDIDV